MAVGEFVLGAFKAAIRWHDTSKVCYQRLGDGSKSYKVVAMRQLAGLPDTILREEHLYPPELPVLLAERGAARRCRTHTPIGITPVAESVHAPARGEQAHVGC